MRKIIIAIFVLVSFQNCVTISKPPKVVNSSIVNGKKLRKLKLPKTNLFIFKNPKKMIHFRNFLAKKYQLENYKFADEIPFQVEDTNFIMKVHTPEFTTSTYNLITAFIDHTTQDCSQEEENDEHITRTEYNYVAIAVYNNYENDCLSTTSMFYNIVIPYIKKLSQSYLYTYENN